MSDVFRFGDWLVEPDRNRLSREAESTQLEPLAMDVLVHLLTHDDQVVSADEVLDTVWPDRHGDPGMVKKRIGQIRRALGDDAQHPSYIETIPKRGYRVIGQVSRVDHQKEVNTPVITAPPSARSSRTGADANGAAEESPAASGAGSGVHPHHGHPTRLIGLSVLTIAVALALVYWWASTRSEEGAPPRPTLAVVPFTYPADDQRLQSYARLMENEFAYHLARVAQPEMDLVQSAADADFVTRGSMTMLAGNPRLFVQVIDTGSGAVMWRSKGLRLPLEPSEELIATRPEQLASLVFQVASMSRNASRLTDSAEAVSELVAGVIETSEMWQGFGGDWNASLAHLERASKLDPEFILPPIFLANLYVNRMGGTLRYEDAAPSAQAYTRRVLELDQNWTWLAGWVATHDLDYRAAAANYEHARRSGNHPASNLAFSLGLLALTQGKPDEAITHFNTALELGAMADQAMAYTMIAHAQFLTGRYEVARKAAETAVVETSGTGAYAHLLALSLKVLTEFYCGDLKAARQTAQRAWSEYGQTDPQALAMLFAMVGETGKARALLRDSEQRWADGEAGLLEKYFWGYFYLGDLDRAFVWMSRAIEDREVGFVASLRRSPALNEIRGDPRFAAAMDRLAEIEREGTPLRSVAYP